MLEAALIIAAFIFPSVLTVVVGAVLGRGLSPLLRRPSVREFTLPAFWVLFFLMSFMTLFSFIDLVGVGLITWMPSLFLLSLIAAALIRPPQDAPRER